MSTDSLFPRILTFQRFTCVNPGMFQDPLLFTVFLKSRAPFQYKVYLCKYGYFHYTDKTIIRQYSYIHNENSYSWETTSLYWDGPQRTASVLPCLILLSLFFRYHNFSINTNNHRSICKYLVFLYCGTQLKLELDSTRRFASEICLHPPLDIYSHTFSR